MSNYQRTLSSTFRIFRGVAARLDASFAPAARIIALSVHGQDMDKSGGDQTARRADERASVCCHPGYLPERDAIVPVEKSRKVELGDRGRTVPYWRRRCP